MKSIRIEKIRELISDHLVGIQDHRMPTGFRHAISIPGFPEAINLLEKEPEQTVESLIEEIGKNMCHFELLYPNAGKWLIQDRWGWQYKADTVLEAFQKFKEELQKNGHIS